MWGHARSVFYAVCVGVVPARAFGRRGKINCSAIEQEEMRIAALRVPVSKVQAPYRKDRKTERAVPDKMSALRRQSGIGDHRSIDPVQGHGLVRHRLRPQRFEQ